MLEAYQVLVDAEARTAYDVGYQHNKAREHSLLGEALEPSTGDDDAVVRERLLSLLYVQRRRDIRRPTIGNVELERLLGCPQELLDFHVWYLKEKGLVEHTDLGFAITALGIDQAESSRHRLPRERLLADRVGAAAHGPAAARGFGGDEEPS